MGADVIKVGGRVYKKVATEQSTPIQDKTPKAITLDRGLTIFLGGAGMAGAYNEDMVRALAEAGIGNPVHGNYAAYSEGPNRYMPDLVGMLGDASAVVLYNQDETDPVVFQYGEPAECEYSEEYVEKKYLFGTITVRKYDEVVCEPPKGVFLAKISRDISEIKETDFSLSKIGVTEPIPTAGQLNIIGYSWGGVIAARTALFHARKDIIINNLVLIGAPINASLRNAAIQHPNIANTHIIDLSTQGDPIYAGMTDKEIVDSSAILGRQMLEGSGHFYYSGDSEAGRARRRQLARELYAKGLR
ncbi:MAG: alpha/beta hydrolase [Gammaproteobacteria bacterium]|jgi:hypothetical protein|nr:alpha/beta hydrolase [Gammaproteobacteria bacterium]MBU1489651.1 alpha/beta hydrolase [Gammaproteobacteria bacterium]MBU2064901.1 alpha/beta hydrolase [Gammaproteobacteria bacterium]MBU2139259.1 alpha/beta hydrolase [Gammaproteobacteria bacterium]MBU2215197.1 alpha/beta hydrolase [Gammaproteobacteria bacterium]